MKRPRADPCLAAGRGARTFPGDPTENYWYRRHLAAYGLAARALRRAGARRILDVGCGEGFGAALLARGGIVHAVELDGPTGAHAARSYPGIRVVRADACHLPYRPDSFDAVCAMQVMEHLYCADGFLRQVRSVLRPAGTLLLSTPNRETFSPDGPNPFHVYEYTAEELDSLLRIHFGTVRVGGLHHGALLRRADRLAGGSFQHLLMQTPFDRLPARLRIPARAVRAGHFQVGTAEGALDLLVTASGLRTEMEASG